MLGVLLSPLVHEPHLAIMFLARAQVVYCAATGHLFSCSRDMSVKQWRREGDEALQSWNHDLTVSAVDVNTGTVGSLRISPFIHVCHSYTMDSPTYNLLHCAVMAAGTRVCSGSRDVSVRVWDVATGAELLKKKIPRNVVSSKMQEGWVKVM